MAGATIRVNTKKLSSCKTGMNDCKNSVQRLCGQLDELHSSISAGDSGLADVKPFLKTIVKKLRDDEKLCRLLSMNIEVIGSLYEKTEKELTGLITPGVPSGAKGKPAGCKSISTIGSLKKLSKQFAASYGDNFKGDLRNAVMESSGSFISTIGGAISIRGASARSVGANAFVMVPRSVSERALKYIKTGQGINAGAKYGVPVIGAAIDYVSLRKSGQSKVDAGVKSVAHLGIGLAGGEAGAMIGGAAGATLGSVIPVAGTAAGLVIGAGIGFCAGAAITTVGNMSFDWLYDNHLKPGFKKAVKKIAGSCQAGHSCGGAAKAF